MSGYLGPQPVPQTVQKRQLVTATAGQTTINTTGYSVGYLDLYHNGVRLVSGDDYTATDGASIVLSNAASAGDTLEWVSLNNVQVLDQRTRLPFFTAAGVSTSVTLNSGSQLPFFKANGSASNISVVV
jgi:hypothetical protein